MEALSFMLGALGLIILACGQKVTVSPLRKLDFTVGTILEMKWRFRLKKP